MNITCVLVCWILKLFLIYFIFYILFYDIYFSSTKFIMLFAELLFQYSYWSSNE